MKGTREFHKRSRNGKKGNKVLRSVTVWEHLARIWPLPGRDSPKQEKGESSLSCLGMVSRNRTSLICINLCIYSHLETYMVLVNKLNRRRRKNLSHELQFLKWSKMNLNSLFTNSWSCSIFLNRTRNLFPAPALLCSAKQASLPDHLLFSWTGPVQISCLSVKSCSLVPSTPSIYCTIRWPLFYIVMDSFLPSVLCYNVAFTLNCSELRLPFCNEQKYNLFSVL